MLEVIICYRSYWFYTRNHKRVGVLYIWLAGFSSLIALSLSLLIRWELVSPGVLNLDPHYYNVVVTAHGVIMLFFVAMPALFGGFGNILVPLMLGCKETYYPRLNNLSFYFNIPGIFLFLLSLVWGGCGTGWTFYPPLSSIPFHLTCVDLAILSLHFAGASSILSSFNFIATVHMLKPRGISWFDLPLFVWSIYLTSWLTMFAIIVLSCAFFSLLSDRWGYTCLYIQGGDPTLFAHIFWFFGHPEVYILVLPVFGLVSHILQGSLNREDLYGRRGMILAMMCIAGIGFFVWGHHMVTMNMSLYIIQYFSIMTAFISIPTGIKIFSWGLMLKGGDFSRLYQNPALLFILGFLFFFTLGGLSGLLLSNSKLDYYYHDTYFVVAHFHSILSLSVVYGIFSGLYFWDQEIFGGSISCVLGVSHFVITFISSLFTFVPMHILGVYGMPRRYFDYDYNPGLQIWHVLTTIGSIFALLSVLYGISILIGPIRVFKREVRLKL
uniref:cytochrome c oxidase subunit I n=1 Tax=Polypodium hydriforme TaxID=43186 RepID=UPI00211541AC|nr:cytochrome c oxidase subunit I [Polypodium hydriforme]USZ79616.1 cytochrome c oxidase subunit I [Polypodium hydriforme]